MIRPGLGFFILVASVAAVSGHGRDKKKPDVQPEVELRRDEPANTKCSDLADKVE